MNCVTILRLPLSPAIAMVLRVPNDSSPAVPDYTWLLEVSLTGTKQGSLP